MPHTVSAASSRLMSFRSSGPLRARPRRYTLDSPRASASTWRAETIADVMERLCEDAPALAEPVLLLRVGRQDDAVARPIGDPERAVFTLRHALEEIGGGHAGPPPQQGGGGACGVA